MVNEGQVFYCTVCGLEVKVTKGGDPTAPITCCDVVMIEVKKRRLMVIRWKCKNCGTVYEDADECPVCDSKKREPAKEEEDVDGIMISKSKQKYVSRYKKGRPLFKRKK